MAKYLDSQNLKNGNQHLEQLNKQLCQKKEQMKCHYADQEAYLEHIYQDSHAVLKGMADIVESLGECSTGGSEKALQNEKAHD